MQEGPAVASFAAAFGAGLISVLSPCVLPLMPAYLSLISGVSAPELRTGNPAALRRRVLQGCAGFVAGFSAVFIALGASASVLGQWLRGFELQLFGWSVTPVQIAGLVIALMGLHVAGWLPIPALYRDARFRTRFTPRSALGTFVIGAAFAFGWSPCVGPILGGILTLAASHDGVGQGTALLATYSLGLGVPFFLAGWSVEWFFSGLERMRRALPWIERVAGVLLIAVGGLVAFDRLSALNGYLAFLNDWIERAESWLQ
jgi:cytochrome c-type biogenesis protein